ncbi:cation diffusion facilitator family transporter [Novosphingobium sp. Leaf2]|uniref:cation diffusion facilitator family transporter n=1 Tax=Novosphingobium sp. Leaf2 TaxID=1735670 RepID=UPI0006F26887|nr:cation diffusion facilitator family transporter [Novosphingobium sp. Leaf2]KQM19323.1 cation transporter [Novosphingobium sp. Leaf2]
MASTSAHIRENIVLYGALAANVGIAIAKFVAAAIGGSSAMATEGVHSLVDSGNQVLLLYGQKRAKRAPDAAHPFGYGRELYFWAFIVAILIFAGGAGISIYEGIAHIQEPHPIEDTTLSFIVLGVAFLMEATSWGIAVKEFNESRKGQSWWRAVRRSKDPAGFIVLFEDSAALIGLVIAAAGIGASTYFGDARLDGVASILIGLVLAAVAVVLAREAKGLLIGEAADPALIAKLRTVMEDSPSITSVNHVRTVHTGPDLVFVAISADFVDDLPMGQAETLIEELETRMKALSPKITSIYIRPEKREAAAVF